MIFLTNDIEPSIIVNKDLLIDYKEQGDIYLVDIRRELTKQLIFYKLYQDLQAIDNSFFFIVGGLLDDKFTEQKELKDGYNKLVTSCNVLKKNLDNILSNNSYDRVCRDLEKLQLLIQKLIYIVDNFCFVEDN